MIELSGGSHQHGSGAPHTHAGLDPHVWADPQAYLQEAAVVAQALRDRRPAEAQGVSQREAALKQRLLALDAELAAAWAPLAGLPLSASHPAFNYVARRYGLNIQSFGFDPAVPPSAEALAEWVAWSAGGGRHLLWEASPSPAVMAAFPPSTVHVVLDPLEQPAGPRYDYLQQSAENVVQIGKIARTSSMASADDGVVPSERGTTLPEMVGDLEVREIKKAWAKSGGNKSRAADMLGLSRFALQRKLEKYGMDPEASGAPAQDDGEREPT